MSDSPLEETPLEANPADVVEQQTPVDPDIPGSSGAALPGDRPDPEELQPTEDEADVPLEADPYDARDQHRTVGLDDEGERMEDETAEA